MNETVFGLFIVIVSGFLQGSFALFLRYMKPLKWENFWGIYSLIALFLGPVLLAIVLVPNFSDALFSIPPTDFPLPILFGALWGIGSILFGLSVIRLGLSLTYTIILGLTTAIGTILPLFITRAPLKEQTLLLLVLGLLFVMSGIILSGYSGILRDKKQNISTKDMLGGLTLALISGIFSPMLNVGFITGKPIALVAQNYGASVSNSTALVWVIVLFAGFLMNISYVTYLLFKNNSVNLFKKINSKILLAVSASGIFWFASFALFGIASVKIGKLGPSIGWAILISLSIVVSNIWGIKFGEWKNSKSALPYQIKSILLIVIGVGLIAASALV